MKKMLFSLITLAISTSNYAANTPTHNWNGPYIGLAAGPAWAEAHAKTINQTTWPFSSFSPGINAAGNQTIHPNGFTAGVEGGYNWYFGRYGLFGLETDIQAMNLSGSTNSGAVGFAGSPETTFTVGSYANINWLATLRPRVGILVDNCFLYLTGGLALSQLNANFYYNDETGSLESGSLNTVKVGPAFGGGLELGINQRFSVKAEYLNVYFNDTNATQTGSRVGQVFPPGSYSYSTNFRANMVRLGFNYKLF